MLIEIEQQLTKQQVLIFTIGKAYYLLNAQKKVL